MKNGKKDVISAELKADLKNYYQTPFRRPRYELPDLFAKQRMSSNQWKQKLMNYILRFESSSWKIKLKSNPYLSRSLSPFNHSNEDIKLKAQQMFIKSQASGMEKSITLLKDSLKNDFFSKNEENLDKKFKHKPFFQHKHRKYKEKKVDSATGRSGKETCREYTSRSLNTIINECNEALASTSTSIEKFNNYKSQLSHHHKILSSRQKRFDESLYKEFMDLKSSIVKKDEEETHLQRKESEEKLIKWMKGEGRLNKFEYMKYDAEVHGMRNFKRKHNLKKIAIQIRNLE